GAPRRRAPSGGDGAPAPTGIAARCLASFVGWRGGGPPPPRIAAEPQWGPPPKSGAFGAARLRLRSHRGAMGPCRPTASLRDAWSPLLAGGAVDQPLPPPWGGRDSGARPPPRRRPRGAPPAPPPAGR